ncbi:MAG: hypothetical protein EOM77_01415 [Bacteroidia bacterium]|nr:hypothetical protein [Bacteroidia bacterium]
MDNNNSVLRLVEYIENSFLKALLLEEQITDISYNGSHVFYQHNTIGRQKSIIEVSEDEVHDFLRHVANLGEKHFSYSEPLLDISFGRYRLNAVHYSLGRVQNNKATTFSLRIASNSPRIGFDGSFMPAIVAKILEALVHGGQSIVIGGQTGTGKTELQKFLLRQIQSNKRIIVIDNVQELTYSSVDAAMDLTSWQVNEHIPQGSFQELIRNSLRSHPDWLIVAESRGKEMIEILNAAMTGHPVITTIHAKSDKAMINRMVRMILMNGGESTYDEIMEDVVEHFRYYIFLNKRISDKGHIVRYLSSILEYDQENRKMVSIFEGDTYHNSYGELTSYTQKIVDSSINSTEIKKIFIK